MKSAVTSRKGTKWALQGEDRLNHTQRKLCLLKDVDNALMDNVPFVETTEAQELITSKKVLKELLANLKKSHLKMREDRNAIILQEWQLLIQRRQIEHRIKTINQNK